MKFFSVFGILILLVLSNAQEPEGQAAGKTTTPTDPAQQNPSPLPPTTAQDTPPSDSTKQADAGKQEIPADKIPSEPMSTPQDQPTTDQTPPLNEHNPQNPPQSTDIGTEGNTVTNSTASGDKKGVKNTSSSLILNISLALSVIFITF